VDDGKLMQEMAGNFMANETRSAIEAAQNYGFTSVVHAATKDAMGKIIDGAETFMSFIGGNRSFPAAGNMDDRRHRLFGLAEGDTAMFRGKDDKQQFHMTGDGGFWSTPVGKVMRMALVPAAQQQQGASAQQTDASGGNGGGGSQQQGQQQRGQKPVKDDNAQSKYFVELNASKQARMAGAAVHSLLDDGNVYVDVNADKNVYQGGQKGKNQFSLVVTLAGPAVNVWGRLDPP
jgi:phage gp45-like